MILLLGISQRTLRATFHGIPRPRNPRKLIPQEPKTMADWLHWKRIEADLSLAELAEKLALSDRTLRAWERGKLVPTEAEWRALATVLALGSGLPRPPSPPVESSVGLCTTRAPRF